VNDLEGKDRDGPALNTGSTPASRRVRLIGLPSSAGGLFNGTEDAPRAYRSAGLVTLLAAAGVDVTDGGDVPIPSFLPRHNGSLHVIYVDGHVDAVAPRADACAGAASMGLWFVTTPSPLWTGPRLDPEAITVVGCAELQDLGLPIQVIDAAAVAEDPTGSAAAALAGVPDDAEVLVHFDVDVLNARDMPAAYSPNPQGLPCDTVRALLRALLQDRRVVAVEVPEYTTQRDLELSSARVIAEMLAGALAG
jgi:arginase